MNDQDFSEKKQREVLQHVYEYLIAQSDDQVVRLALTIVLTENLIHTIGDAAKKIHTLEKSGTSNLGESAGDLIKFCKKHHKKYE